MEKQEDEYGLMVKMYPRDPAEQRPKKQKDLQPAHSDINEIVKHLSVPSNGNGKAHSPEPIEQPQPPQEQISDYKATDTEMIADEVADLDYHPKARTMNLNFTSELPPNVNLHFIDPKAVEWPRRAAPALKNIIERMSTSQSKPPRPILLYGMVGFIACFGIGIAYSMTYDKWQQSEHDFQLQWLKAQQIGGHGNGTYIPPSAAPKPTPQQGGGPAICIVNPLAPPVTHC